MQMKTKNIKDIIFFIGFEFKPLPPPSPAGREPNSNYEFGILNVELLSA
jgi:hypothetical protein